MDELEKALLVGGMIAIIFAFQLSRITRYSDQFDHNPIRFLARFLSRCVRWFVIPALFILPFILPINPFLGLIAAGGLGFSLWIGARYLEAWITGE